MARDLELALRIRADLGAARRDIAALRGDVQRLGGAGTAAAPGLARSGQQIDRMQRSAAGLSGGLRNLRGALAALGVGVLVREAAQAGLALDRMERGLLAATGSADGAAEAMAFVRAESKRLGLDLASAGAQFAALSAAARGTALEGAGARDIFSAVAEASVVMGLSADQTAGALTAIQQMISKGTVSAEELRGQLGERLPGAFQIAARAMGVTTAELGNMLQAGDVAAEQMLPRFAAELRKTFGGALPSSVNSAQAAINRFRTQVFEAQAAFARSGFLDGLTQGLEGFSSALDDPGVQSGLAALGQGLGNLIALAGRAAAQLRDLAPLIGTVGGALAGGRAGAMLGSPFGPQVAGVTGAIGLVAGGVGGNLVGRDMRGQPTAPGTGRIERTPPAPPPPVELPPLPSQAAVGSDKAAASESDQRAKAITSVIAALREEADTFGLTAEQAQVYRLSTLGATDAQIEQAMAAASEIAALRDKAAADTAAAEAQQRRAEEAARMAQADRDVAEALAEELRLITLGGRERAQEEATRRLSASATDEQRRAVEALAGALYDQQQAAKETGDQMSEFAVEAAHNMQDAFADFLFDPFSDGLRGMLSGFADALRRMASEALAAKLGEALFGSLLTGGAGAAAGGAGGGSGLIGGLLAGLFHGGGLAGNASAYRRMPAVMMATAPRYHGGGLAGLAPDEVPAVLRRGEEVLTANDPRHRNNGGGIASAPAQVTVRNINLFDTQVIGDYLSTSAGERVVLNVVSRNKAALGIG